MNPSLAHSCSFPKALLLLAIGGILTAGSGGELLAQEPIPTLHVIHVADTLSLKSVPIDMKKWKSKLDEIEGLLKTELTIKRQVIKETNWGGSHVWNACRDLVVKPDDAILFLYSGHGFATIESAQRSKWPAMALMKKTDGSPDNLELTAVYNILAKKNPRLLLVIADCCNELVESAKLPPENLEEARGSHPEPADQYRALFVKAKGRWIVSGCEQGVDKFSYASKTLGGYFTLAFFRELDKVVTSRKRASDFKFVTPTWQMVFDGLNKKNVHVKWDDEEERFLPYGDPQLPQVEEDPKFNY